MRRPRRRTRRLLSNQSLLAHNHDPTLPRPRPTRHSSLHHITAPHRRWQSDLCPSAETDQDHHLGPGTPVDHQTARVRGGLQGLPERENTRTQRAPHPQPPMGIHTYPGPKGIQLAFALIAQQLAVCLSPTPARSTRTSPVGSNHKQPRRRSQRTTQTHRRRPPRQIRGTTTQDARVVPALENATA